MNKTAHRTFDGLSFVAESKFLHFLFAFISGPPLPIHGQVKKNSGTDSSRQAAVRLAGNK